MRAGVAFGAAVAALALAGAAGAGGTPRDAAQTALTSLINAQIRAEGSFFTPAEQKVIEAKCGYRPGEWDRFEASMIDGRFHCTNGRTLDDPEIKAVMRAAQPRIERRVSAVMARADVRAAIDQVAREATREAMREIGSK